MSILFDRWKDDENKEDDYDGSLLFRHWKDDLKHIIDCERCDGVGKIGKIECPECMGTGRNQRYENRNRT